MRSLLFTLFKVNILKTLLFNFKYLPLRQAVKLPVFIYRRTALVKTQGKIVIDADVVSPGMIMIGKKVLGTTDVVYERTVWEQRGTVCFHGQCIIGQGSKVSVGKGAMLTFGNYFSITGRSTLICSQSIDFGDDTLLSWEVLVMDTDFHQIYDKAHQQVNADKAVSIGNHVWVGCRATILKGVQLADHSIVAANSTLTRSFTTGHEVVGGVNRVLNTEVTWDL